MNKLKNQAQIETIKAQCSALQSKGFTVIVNFYSDGIDTRSTVVISTGLRAWHLSDPDLGVIISQLVQLQTKFDKKIISILWPF